MRRVHAFNDIWRPYYDVITYKTDSILKVDDRANVILPLGV